MKHHLALFTACVCVEACANDRLFDGDELHEAPEGFDVLVPLRTADLTVDTGGIDIASEVTGSTLSLRPGCGVVHGFGEPVLAPVMLRGGGTSDVITLLVTPSYQGACTPSFSVTYDGTGSAVGDSIETDPGKDPWSPPLPFTIKVDGHDPDAPLDVVVATGAPDTFLALTPGVEQMGARFLPNPAVRGDFEIRYWATLHGDTAALTTPQSIALTVGASPSISIELVSGTDGVTEFKESTLLYRVWARGVSAATPARVTIARATDPLATCATDTDCNSKACVSHLCAILDPTVGDPDASPKPLIRIVDGSDPTIVSCGSRTRAPAATVSDFPHDFTVTIAPGIDAAPWLLLNAAVETPMGGPSYSHTDLIPVVNQADDLTIQGLIGAIACTQVTPTTIELVSRSSSDSGTAGVYHTIQNGRDSSVSLDGSLPSSSILRDVLMAEGTQTQVLGELCSATCEVRALQFSPPAWSTMSITIPARLSDVRVVPRMGDLAVFAALVGGNTVNLFDLSGTLDSRALGAVTSAKLMVVDIGEMNGTDRDHDLRVTCSTGTIDIDVRLERLSDPVVNNSVPSAVIGLDGVGHSATPSSTVLYLDTAAEQILAPTANGGNTHVILNGARAITSLTPPTTRDSRELATVRGVGTFELLAITNEVATWAQRDPVALQSRGDGVIQIDPNSNYGAALRWCPDGSYLVTLGPDSTNMGTRLRWSRSDITVDGPWPDAVCNQ